MHRLAAAPKTIIISMNTELFRLRNAHVVDGKTTLQAQEHLLWLNRTLAAAYMNSSSAYIIGHCPPGMETGTIKAESFIMLTLGNRIH